MSRDERRELAEINQRLSSESELTALAALFAQPPGGRAVSPAGPVPVVRHPDRSRQLLSVAMVAVVVAVVGACALASSGGSVAIGMAAVLVVGSGLGLALALRRYVRD